MRFALLVTLLSGCRAACMLPSATEPTTSECQTLCDAGSCGCSAPWYSYQSTIDAWSSGYRWDSTGIFDFYDWAAGEYKCCNGHINNYHWSMFCDNSYPPSTGYNHPLGPGCTTTTMSAGHQTPFGSTSTAYYRFHDHDDKAAYGDYLFYFR